MKNIGIKAVKGFFAAMFCLIAFGACNQAGAILNLPGVKAEALYRINISPNASGKVYAEKTGVAEGETVVLYAREGITIIVNVDDASLGMPVTPNFGIGTSTDKDVLDRLGGAPSARKFSFVMPESDVTITIREASSSSVGLLQGVKIEKETADGFEQVYWTGAPTPSLVEAQVPTGVNLRVTLTAASGVNLGYNINRGGDQPLDGTSFNLPPVGENSFVNFAILASQGETALSFPYKLCSWAVQLSNDATLSSITISPDIGTFDPNTQTLKYTVENEVDEIDITAVTSHSRATLRLNGGATFSNAENKLVLQKLGDSEPNIAEYLVTAQDGVTTKTYKVEIVRKKSSNAYLAQLSATVIGSYGFKYNEFNYDLKDRPLPSLVNTVDITPVPADKNAKLTFNNSPVAGGAVIPFALSNQGENNSNDVVVVVTAQDGVTKNTYTLKIYRDETSETDGVEIVALDSITLTNPSISSFVFNAQTTLYDLAANPVHNDVSNISVTASSSVASSKITINDVDAASGVAVKVDLKETGAVANKIIVSIVKDDKVMASYEILVYRAAATDARLVKLELTPSIPFTLKTEGGEHDLSQDNCLLPNATETLVLTPTVNDANAKITINSNAVKNEAQYILSLTGYGSDHSNDVKIVVTAPDMLSKREYTFKFYRALNSDVTLINLTSAGGNSMVQGFTPLGEVYNLNRENDPLSYMQDVLAITPTANNKQAIITINDEIVPSASSYLWQLGEPDDSVVKKYTLHIVVRAASGAGKTYTVNVWRGFDAGNNAELLCIDAAVLDEGLNVGARVYPVEPDNANNTEFRLHAYGFEKLIKVTAKAKDKNTVVIVENGDVEYNHVITGDWTEASLEPPVLIKLIAKDGTTKIYTVSNVVLTPGKEVKKTPIAKGGKISWVGNDELHSWHTDERNTNKKDELKFFGKIPAFAHVLVQGGGGAGGERIEEYSAYKAGGGGGGAGGVIENKSYEIDGRISVVEAGRGGTGKNDIQGESGSNSRFGTIVAQGGIGGYNTNKNKSFRNGEEGELLIVGLGGSEAVFMSPEFNLYETAKCDGGYGGEANTFWQILGGGAQSAVAIIINWNLMQSLCVGHWWAIPLILAGSTAVAGDMWVPFATGGAGGGGANPNPTEEERAATIGENGSAHFWVSGGSGGPGLKSAITGEEKEYGKGGRGGGGNWSGGAEPGRGGNSEYIVVKDENKNNEKDGEYYRDAGNGTVISRFAFVWR
ncbi:MAG: cadherin-like beta sandwich domain-containing protein [Spirochaetaceae bacterium]|jgi:hypothetical protein|nr:cadherin-like beta sandwich domain-containing protein [Spirochaetaceae bacterium]